MKNIKEMLLLTTTAIVFATALSIAPCNAQAEEPTAAPTQPAPQEPETRRPERPKLTIKPSASIYWPSSDKAQARFGDTWSMLGFAIDFRDDDRSRDRFQFQIEGIRRESGNDHAYVYPVGFKYTHRLNTSLTFSPFIGGMSSLCLVDVKSQVDNVDTGFRSAGIGGSVFVGADLGMNLKLQASYNYIPKIKSFDLSGFSIGATLQF